MNYELCKQLKDAGFPQTLSGGRLKNGHYIVDGKEPCYDPTLKELIRACGDKIVISNLNDYSEKTDIWRAGIAWAGWDDGSAWIRGRDGSEDYPCGKGSTPEEAVAKLWLELNKK